MAKTKWIVPAVALVLCAASLIGAGYAAYSATLTDNETVTADNNFVVLSLGATQMESEVKIYYNSTVDYTNHANPVSKYYPTLDNGQSTELIKVLVGSFTVAANVTNIGDEDTVNGYRLSVQNLNTGIPLTGVALNVYRTYSEAEGVFSNPVTLSEMAFGTTYYLALEYQQNDEDVLDAAPAATMNITFKLSAAANIVNA